MACRLRCKFETSYPAARAPFSFYQFRVKTLLRSEIVRGLIRLINHTQSSCVASMILWTYTQWACIQIWQLSEDDHHDVDCAHLWRSWDKSRSSSECCDSCFGNPADPGDA